MKHHWAILRERAGLSQENVAQELGVSRAYIVKLEQGLLSYPTHLATLAQVLNSSEDALYLAYGNYQRQTRLDFKAKHPSFYDVLTHYDGPVHPLVYYRETEGLSQIGFCKGLCLHPGPIRNYEANKQRSLPEQLKDVCDRIYWNWHVIEWAVNNWRINGYADAAKIQA